MNILIFIIFIMSISALVIGCLAYTHTRDSTSSSATSAEQGWANLGDTLYYGTGGPCVCSQLPFEFNEAGESLYFSCKNGKAVPGGAGTNFPSIGSCYNSKQQCMKSECNPNKIGYKKDPFTKGGSCDCAPCDLKDHECTKQSYDTCVNSICPCCDCIQYGGRVPGSDPHSTPDPKNCIEKCKANDKCKSCIKENAGSSEPFALQKCGDVCGCY